MDGGAGLPVQFEQSRDLVAIGAVGMAGDERAATVGGIPIRQIGQRGHAVRFLTAIDGQQPLARRHRGSAAGRVTCDTRRTCSGLGNAARAEVNRSPSGGSTSRPIIDA